MVVTFIFALSVAKNQDSNYRFSIRHLVQHIDI